MLRRTLTTALLLTSPGLFADTLPVIHVQGIVPADLAGTPGAAVVLDKQHMDTLRAHTLHDLLDSIAGLRTIDDDALGRRSAIGVRGAPPRRSRKTLLLEDGVPINLSAYLDASAHYTPPMERLAGIDVLKGAGQVVHGPLNNHGIVNFRNQRAGDTPATHIRLSAGSQHSFARHISHSRRQNDLDVVLAYTGLNADGVFDVEQTQFDDFYLQLGWNFSHRQRAELSLTHHRERSNYDESNLTPQEYAQRPFSKRERFGQQYNTFALDYRKLALTHEFELSDRLEVNSLFFATDADRPRFTVDPGRISVGELPQIEFVSGAGAFTPDADGVMVSRDRHYRTRGIDTRVTWQQSALGAWQRMLHWGLRAEQHALNDMRSTGSVGELLDINSRGPRNRDVAYTALAASSFVEQLIIGNRWQITPGLRAEYYEQDKRRRIIARDPGPHAPPESDYNTLLLPSLSLLYRLDDNSQAFANLARGYTPAPARTADNFPLRPETGVNSQIGLRSQPAAGVTIEAALFHNWISNTIVQLPFSVDNMSLVLNSADSTSRGVDLGVDLDSAPLSDSPHQWFAQLAYNHTSARFTEDFADAGIRGKHVPEVAEQVGTLTAGWRHAVGWQGSLSWTHMGAFFTDPINTRDLVLTDSSRRPLQDSDVMSIREPHVLGRVPSHSLLSARLQYQRPGSDAVFWLQGRNLTNRQYIVDLENGIRPGARRTLMIGLSHSW